jgi:uncharacterized protein YcfJ
MTSHIRLRSVAFGACALLMAAAPAATAFAQPYQNQDQYRQAQYEEQRRAYDAQYGPGAYDRYYADQNDRDAREACHDEKKGNAVGGALLGGIAGAVIGSNVARGGGREGGAIIGGVGGAALGSNIAKNSTHCDGR